MGIIFPTFVLFLSVIDAFTTWYVVTNGIGYETNAAIAWATNNVEFYLLKVIITALMLYGIASFCNGYEKLRMVSFTSIAIFYSIIVLNNIMAIVAGIDLNLNLTKNFILFGAIFALSNIISGILSHQTNQA